MATIPNGAKIYKQIVDMLEYAHLDRRDIISRCLKLAGLTAKELADSSLGSLQNNLRVRVGSVLSEMEARELIRPDTDGLYYLVSARPVVIRVEKCEKEILKALSAGSKTKSELRELLTESFGTHKTATTRDDETLSTIMGQVLKRLEAMGVIINRENVFSLSKHASARAGDMNAMLELRGEFLARVHSRGGEFFEHYFMALLSKYSEKHNKKIIECYVTGGSADGGIDGVMKTEDTLGFREITMVQTKNRVEMVNETDVRGFYGAVCAKRGTRGMFVTTADFHNAAMEFIDSLDDLIGVSGDRVFKMAVECLYGIKRSGGKYVVDTKIV